LNKNTIVIRVKSVYFRTTNFIATFTNILFV